MTASTSAQTSLTDLCSPTLTRRLAELLGDERRCLVDFLRYLAEVDRRNLHLELGYPSLFAYCVGPLRLTNASAWRRTTSARLMARFPIVADYLADGRLCLSTLVHLREVLDPDNLRDLLDRASLKTEDEVRLVVASLRPRPEVPTSIRRLPARPPSASGPEMRVAAAGPAPVKTEAPLPPTLPAGPGLFEATTSVAPAASAPVPVPVARARIEPLDSERHSLRMTVGREFLDELAQVKSALSHIVPDGNLEAVLRVCIQKTLVACARRKHAARSSLTCKTAAGRAGTASPSRSSGPELASSSNAGAASPSRTSGPEPSCPDGHLGGVGTVRRRYLTAEVRRAVWERDLASCSHVGAEGKRCGSTHQLEFDHEEPFARGGASTVEGVSLRCRAHNQHRARQHFGVAHMARYARSPR